MAIVREMTNGLCKVYIHDDAIVRTEKEVIDIITEMARICGKEVVEIRKSGKVLK